MVAALGQRTAWALAALLWCLGLGLALAHDRILSASVDIALHLQVVEALRGHLFTPSGYAPYLAEMNVYPKLSHRLAALAAGAGLEPIRAMAVIGCAAAATGWLAIFDLARRMSWRVVAAILALGLIFARAPGAVLGQEVIGNFFYPQVVSEGFALAAAWFGLSVMQRSRWAFLIYAPAVVFICGRIHLIGALTLAGAFALLAAFEIALRRTRGQDLFSAWSATIALIVLALIANPSFKAMGWLSKNNGSVNFAGHLGQPGLALAAAALILIAGIGLGMELRRRAREVSDLGDAAGPPAARLLLAWGFSVGLAALCQLAALRWLGQGSDYAVLKHAFGVFTAIAFAVPVLAWELATERGAAPGRPAGWGAWTAVAAQGLVMASLFLRPSQMDVSRLTALLSETRELRPASEAGGDGWVVSARGLSPLESYMATTAELRADRAANVFALLATGAPDAPGEIAHLVTLAGDPGFDKPACRQGPPRRGLVIVNGACVARPPIHFKSGGADARTLGRGWSAPEAYGVFFDGDQATLTLPLPERIATEPTPRLIVQTFAFLPWTSPNRHGSVGIEGGASQSFAYNRSRAIFHAFVLPIPAAAAKAGAAVLVFRNADPAVPRALGVRPDDRRLGLGLESVTIE
jgi:hypothetical protein